ncbi:MAG TPA: hypothetical protein VIS57_02935 [Xanthomonadales bacterium]
MLIYRLRDIYREITGYIEPVPFTTVMNPFPAANADNITQSDMQARRQRRQRRADRAELRNAKGWTIRSW